MLTSKEIVERNIIFDFCEEGVQQQGIDVRLDSVGRLQTIGEVFKEKKANLPTVFLGR